VTRPRRGDGITSDKRDYRQLVVIAHRIWVDGGGFRWTRKAAAAQQLVCAPRGRLEKRMRWFYSVHRNAALLDRDSPFLNLAGNELGEEIRCALRH
jgi:hypothetical protein